MPWLHMTRAAHAGLKQHRLSLSRAGGQSPRSGCPGFLLRPLLGEQTAPSPSVLTWPSLCVSVLLFLQWPQSEWVRVQPSDLNSKHGLVLRCWSRTSPGAFWGHADLHIYRASEASVWLWSSVCRSHVVS